MKKMTRMMMVTMMTCAVMMGLMMLCPKQADAATTTKVTEVKLVTKQNKSDGSVSGVLKGLNKKGKVVWKYKTGTSVYTGGYEIEYVINKGKVYLFHWDKLTIIRKKDGKVIKELTLDGFQESHLAAFDEDGNLYTTAYWGVPVYKISPKGKIIWKSTETEGYLVESLKLKGNKLILQAEKKKLTFNAKNGKLKKITKIKE